MQKLLNFMAIILFFLFISSESGALEVSEKLSLEGTFAGVYQWLNRSTGEFKSKNRGSGMIDLGVSFKPTERDEFYILGSFGSGNGLKDVSPFLLSPNADDLEDDVKNINGHRKQDNLLEAWYAHTFKFNNSTSLKITAGIIDATVYIDDNRLANCEINQFMNDVFVNTPLSTPPSYDLGVVAELEKGPFNLKVLGMSTKNPDIEIGEKRGVFYKYYALQLGYKLETKFGEGNYRIYGFLTSKVFPKRESEFKKEKLKGVGISLDQDLGFINNPFSQEPLGFFLRTGWQDDEVLGADYKHLISVGLRIPFEFLGKKGNELGIGYAYLKGADKGEVSYTHASEIYIKFKLFEYEKKLSSDLTLDFQYLKDRIRGTEERAAFSNEGLIFGLRWIFSF
ncbi:MAG: hypothetical protein RMI74_07065 [Thermodesulfobacterium sp.]|nr:hypothetical protein [Thermodesulfobacterium sp.]